MADEPTPPSSPPKPFRWLSEILNDPDALKAPAQIVRGLAWHKHLTLLAAREKSGKSTLASAAAAAVSRGGGFLGAPTTQANVLIISLEESTALFSQRLVKFGADPTRIAVVERGGGTGNLLDDIWKTAEEVKPALIIWDTLGAFANEISGKPLDPGDAQGWTRVMLEVLDVAREFGASLLLHHAKKSDGTYRDSTAIGAAVDVILEMSGEGSDPRTIKSRGRLHEVSEIRIKLDDNEYHLVETLADVKERLFDFIATHPRCTMRAIYDGVGARAKEVTKARDLLLKEGRIANMSNGQEHLYIASRQRDA